MSETAPGRTPRIRSVAGVTVCFLRSQQLPAAPAPAPAPCVSVAWELKLNFSFNMQYNLFVQAMRYTTLHEGNAILKYLYFI